MKYIFHILHIDTFPMEQELCQLESMQKWFHLEVDLHVFTTIIQEDAMSSPIIHEKGASHVIMMKKTLEDSILLLYLRVELLKPNS